MDAPLAVRGVFYGLLIALPLDAAIAYLIVRFT
jgi:hypothetical protein